MSRYAIDGQTLTDIADSIRSKTGETRTDYFTNSSHTYRYYANEIDVSVQYCWPTNCHHIKLTNINSDYEVGAGSWHVKFEWGTTTSYLWSYELVDGYVKTLSNNSSIGDDRYGGWSFKITNCIDCRQNFELNFTANYYDENDNLITCEIWEVVPNMITPEDMATQISDMAVIDSSVLEISGNDLSYKFYYGSWDGFLTAYGDKMTANNITAINHAFTNSKITKVPFEINCNSVSAIPAQYMCQKCYSLTEAPIINNLLVGDISYMFEDCRVLREFPEGYGENWDWTKHTTATSGYSGYKNNMLKNCYSLRKLPMGLFKYGNPVLGYSYHPLREFADLYVLDEIVDMPYPHNTACSGTGYSGLFYNSFQNLYRIKNFTFAPDIGVKQWAKQVLDFSKYFGHIEYISDVDEITKYNSGITEEDYMVDSDERYQALKDSPDWFALGAEYSRYNHDSAVATINSLPDCSAYVATVSNGTNTIKFQGAAGEKTDGGAINTLTNEEIAVATAKGWTVTLV